MANIIKELVDNYPNDNWGGGWKFVKTPEEIYEMTANVKNKPFPSVHEYASKYYYNIVEIIHGKRLKNATERNLKILKSQYFKSHFEVGCDPFITKTGDVCQYFFEVERAYPPKKVSKQKIILEIKSKLETILMNAGTGNFERLNITFKNFIKGIVDDIYYPDQKSIKEEFIKQFAFPDDFMFGNFSKLKFHKNGNYVKVFGYCTEADLARYGSNIKILAKTDKMLYGKFKPFSSHAYVMFKLTYM